MIIQNKPSGYTVAMRPEPSIPFYFWWNFCAIWKVPLRPNNCLKTFITSLKTQSFEQTTPLLPIWNCRIMDRRTDAPCICWIGRSGSLSSSMNGDIHGEVMAVAILKQLLCRLGISSQCWTPSRMRNELLPWILLKAGYCKNKKSR